MEIIIRINNTEQLYSISNIDKNKKVEIIINDNPKKKSNKKNNYNRKIKKNEKTNNLNNFYAQSKIYCSPNSSDLPLPVFD